MKEHFKAFSSVVISFILIVSSCTSVQQVEMKSNNILLQVWVGPYGGVPAFDKMNLADVKPALEKGMELKLAEIDEIANNPEAPTFKNTIEAMERSGQELGRAFTYYWILSNNMSSEEFRNIKKEMAPKISKNRSKILQNKKLFDRIKAVYEYSQNTPLEAEQQRVIQLVYEEFAMNGAELGDASKKRYADIEKELSSLYTDFSNNVLADEEGYVVYLSKDQLSGLPESFVKAAAQTAIDNGEDGKYAITNTESVVEPFLRYSDERELRKKV